MGNQSDLKDQSKLVQKKENIAKVENQTKKQTWLNKVDKRALLNIFGWGGFALAGAGWLYEKVKFRKQNEELNSRISQLQVKLVAKIGQVNRYWWV